MTYRHSLSFRLSALVALAQTGTFLVTLVVMCFALMNRDAQTVSEGMARAVAAAISVGGSALALDRGKLPEHAVASGNLWLVARDLQGRRLQVGQVPREFNALVEQMTVLEPTDFSTNSPSALASRLVITGAGDNRLWVLVGGVARSGLLHQSVIVFKYVGLWIAIPVLIATSLILPWVIHGGLRGIARVAEAASHISLQRRDRMLDPSGVPREIRPLVAAFNAALARIWSAFDARDRFLADAAHELRMPIAILAARIESTAPPAIRPRLMTDVARLENIAEQLLDLQRLDNDRWQRDGLDLRKLCRQLAEQIAPLIVDAGYAFELDLPEQPVIIVGDEVALQRMITSLLQNAMSHGGDRGIISLALDATGCVEVGDEGPGIPDAEEKRIFAPFYRIKPTGGGSGLGLHLAQQVALAHGASITVHRSARGGAAFRVHLAPTSDKPRPA